MRSIYTMFISDRVKERGMTRRESIGIGLLVIGSILSYYNVYSGILTTCHSNASTGWMLQCNAVAVYIHPYLILGIAFLIIGSLLVIERRVIRFHNNSIGFFHENV